MNSELELVTWKEINFYVNDKADLPSLEVLQGEIEQYIPKSFTVEHEINCKETGKRSLDIRAKKLYNSSGVNSYLWCIVRQNDKKSVNSYLIEIRGNIGKSLVGEYAGTTSYTWAVIIFLLYIVSLVAAFFTGGATLLLTVLIYLYGKFDDRKLNEETKYLLDCREQIFQSLKELERELNMKRNDQKYSNEDSSINYDRISALKEKLTSLNGGNGFKIAEDGTIIRN